MAMKPAWKRTASGRYINLLDVKPKDIVATDIAISLNQLIRFDGHYTANKPLTVLQHSGLVLHLAEQDGASVAVQLLALLHDAHEYLFGDIGSPVKTLIGPDTEVAEKTLSTVVEDWAGISPTKAHRAAVTEYDLAALNIERMVMWADSYKSNNDVYWPPVNRHVPVVQEGRTSLYENAQEFGITAFLTALARLKSKHRRDIRET